METMSSKSLKNRILARKSGVQESSVLDTINNKEDLVRHESVLGGGGQSLSETSAASSRQSVPPAVKPPANYVPPLPHDLLKKILSQNPGDSQKSERPPIVPPSSPPEQPAPANATEAFYASRRFGLGPKPGDLDRIHAMGARNWVLNQLEAATLDYARDKPTVRENAQVARYLSSRLFRTGSHNQSDGWKPHRKYGQPYATEQGFLFYRDLCATDYDVRARIDLFWGTHHFSTHTHYANRAHYDYQLGVYAFVTDLIHQHSLGNFADMVIAVAKSHKMMAYLDNMNNRGRVGQGLNENFGRELLELHTLGADNGYTQADVVAVSQMLTGWSVESLPDNPTLDQIRELAGKFRFLPQWHNEDHGISGNRRSDTYVPVIDHHTGIYHRNEGLEKGEEVIRLICQTSNCARFIATKLLKEFVSENPSASDIQAVMQVFLAHKDSPQQLKEVYKAIFTLDSAWNFSNQRYKFADHYMISMYRALGIIDKDINPNIADPAFGLRPSNFDLTPDYLTNQNIIQPDWDLMYWQDLERFRQNFQDLKNHNPAPTQMEVLNRKLLGNLFQHTKSPRGSSRQYQLMLGFEYGRHLTPEGPDKSGQACFNPTNAIARIEIIDDIANDVLSVIPDILGRLSSTFMPGSPVIAYLRNLAGQADVAPATLLTMAFMSEEFLRR